MKRFTLDESSMPFNFFEAVGFSFDEIAIQAIQQKFTFLSRPECQDLFDNNYDLFSEEICELRDSAAIIDYCIGECEVDESSGTWGYLHFEVDNLEWVKNQLAAEALVLFNKAITHIKF